MIEHNGQSYPFGNCTVIVASYIMHWDPKIFPEPSQFWPERFLETPSSDSGDDCNGSVDRTSATSSGDAKSGELRRHPKQPPFPRSAHRPFERGVRSCLGRHLAMDEMRLMLVVTARFFDFELVNHKPTATPTLSFTDHDTRIGIHAFQRARLTAGPCGPVWMKVRLAAGAAGNGDT